MGQATSGRTAFCSDSASGGSRSSKILIHSNCNFLKPFLEITVHAQALETDNQQQEPKIDSESAAFCFAQGFSGLQEEERKDPEHFLCLNTHLFYNKTDDSYSCY